MELVDALDTTFEHTSGVISRVRPDQYDDATPCSEWTVRELLEHMIAVVDGIGRTAAGTPSAEFALGSDPAGQFRAAAAATAAAWHAPGVLERVVDGPGGPMPGRVLAGINLLDTATHAWDLAVATGQPTALPDGVAAVALDASSAIVGPELRPGRFGPEVQVGTKSDPTDRLVAFLGRRPS